MSGMGDHRPCGETASHMGHAYWMNFGDMGDVEYECPGVPYDWERR